ncbi:hypothetical protein VTO42DRAFT_3990 [Malbranchea cinnamomea]
MVLGWIQLSSAYCPRNYFTPRRRTTPSSRTKSSRAPSHSRPSSTLRTTSAGNAVLPRTGLRRRSWRASWAQRPMSRRSGRGWTIGNGVRWKEHAWENARQMYDEHYIVEQEAPQYDPMQYERLQYW